MILQDISSKRRTMVTFNSQELTKMFTNGQISIRETNLLRVRSIKKYIFDNALTEKIYLPPLVANLMEGSLEDKQSVKLSIIDGTQRLKALSQLEEKILRALKMDGENVKKAYKLQSLLNQTDFAFQIFEGLTDDECSQLYLDLNMKGKKVSLSKRISFDSRNNLNNITNQILHSHPNLQIAGVEMEKRAIIRPRNKNFLSLSQLRHVIGIFITGKLNHNIDEKNLVFNLESHEYIGLVHQWFNELFTFSEPKRIGNYEESMLASFPMLISIALFANEKMENQPFLKRKEILISRMEKLKNVDWNPDNPIWKEFNGSYKGRPIMFYLSNDKRNIENLVRWLYSYGR